MIIKANCLFAIDGLKDVWILLIWHVYKFTKCAMGTKNDAQHNICLAVITRICFYFYGWLWLTTDDDWKSYRFCIDKSILVYCQLSHTLAARFNSLGATYKLPAIQFPLCNFSTLVSRELWPIAQFKGLREQESEKFHENRTMEIHSKMSLYRYLGHLS